MSAREVAVTRTLPVSPEKAWALLVDPRNHVRWIPMTRVDLPGARTQVGVVFTAKSGPFIDRGAPGVVDRMRIDRVDPPSAGQPGVAVFTKVGPVLRGEARIVVVDDGAGHARVTWSEAVELAGPVGAGLLVAPVLHAMLALVLHRVNREVSAH